FNISNFGDGMAKVLGGGGLSYAAKRLGEKSYGYIRSTLGLSQDQLASNTPDSSIAGSSDPVRSSQVGTGPLRDPSDGSERADQDA
ncbi:MAG: hypothetical protein ACREQ5_22530, partial [Candidatus Dormibacteria bacterium]